jgi:uncharacterized protein (TIGR02246 family)
MLSRSSELITARSDVICLEIFLPAAMMPKPRTRPPAATRCGKGEPMTSRYLAIAGTAIMWVAPALAEVKIGPCTGPQDACQELSKVPQSFAATFNNKDTAAIAALFTQDAIRVTEGPILFGRNEIERNFDDAFKAGFSNLNINVVARQVIGDVAWGVGDWDAMGPGPNNKTQLVHGHWANVYVRDGGGWKIRTDTYNVIENSPPQATAAPASR